MSQDITVDELYAALRDEFHSEKSLHRKAVLALHLRDYELGDRSERLRARMSKLLCYRRGGPQ